MKKHLAATTVHAHHGTISMRRHQNLSRTHLDSMIDQPGSVLTAGHDAFEDVFTSTGKSFATELDLTRPNDDFAAVPGRPMLRSLPHERRVIELRHRYIPIFGFNSQNLPF